MISWSGVSSSPDLTAPPLPPTSHPQQGKRSSFPRCSQAFGEAVFSARTPWPCSVQSLDPSPLLQRGFQPLLQGASLPSAPVPVAQRTHRRLCPAHRTLLWSGLLSCRRVPAQVRRQLCKNKSPGRGISRMLPPLTLNSACLLPKLMWCARGNQKRSQTRECPALRAPLSAHWAIASSPAMPHSSCLRSLNPSPSGADGPCLPLATERWLPPVPSPPPTQAGPRLFIVQVQTSGAQALPTPRTELSRPQLSKNRLHRVHTVVKRSCWASKR